MEYILSMKGCQPRIPGVEFGRPIDWTISPGETWAITGDNGSGKTVLSRMIAGELALKTGKIKYGFLDGSGKKAWQTVRILSFDSVYGLADFRNAYYQQRWHSSENDEMPTVFEIFGPDADPEILAILGTEELLEKKINFLSSGELRKTLITKTLLEEPELLIVDNPFIGLDAASRETVGRLLRELVLSGRTRLIFTLSDPNDIPPFVTHVFPLKGMTPLEPVIRERFFQKNDIPRLPENPSIHSTFTTPSAEPLIELQNIVIRYGRKTVLSGIDWNIGAGEKWVLLGPNGSGKSTLLSLINADHPQAYSNDVRIFGRRRGVGQSIWEVKKRIGYVSPEMHTHYYQNIPAIDVVGSGLHDTIGTVTRCDEKETVRSLRWLDEFGVAHLADRSFVRLSSGEQRLVLLARAFVKEPELLILDEPLHGLDVLRKIRVRNIIQTYCAAPRVTLIYVTHYSNEIPPCVNKEFRLPNRN